MTFEVGHHTMLIVKSFKEIIQFYSVIGKKNKYNNREIPNLGSTDNARISVNLVSGIIRLPSGWDFPDCMGD